MIECWVVTKLRRVEAMHVESSSSIDKCSNASLQHQPRNECCAHILSCLISSIALRALSHAKRGWPTGETPTALPPPLSTCQITMQVMEYNTMHSPTPNNGQFISKQSFSIWPSTSLEPRAPTPAAAHRASPLEIAFLPLTTWRLTS